MTSSDLTAGEVLARRWMHRASCAVTANPDAWFPDNDSTAEDVADAVRVCMARCPVRAHCAAYALATEQHGGIAAGVVLGDNHDTNAAMLRHELTDTTLSPDLVEVFDAKATVRQARREARARGQQTRRKLTEPVRLRTLLSEYATDNGIPVAQADRECA